MPICCVCSHWLYAIGTVAVCKILTSTYTSLDKLCENHYLTHNSASLWSWSTLFFLRRKQTIRVVKLLVNAIHNTPQVLHALIILGIPMFRVWMLPSRSELSHVYILVRSVLVVMCRLARNKKKHFQFTVCCPIWRCRRLTLESHKILQNWLPITQFIR